jgi:hypothetical protein
MNKDDAPKVAEALKLMERGLPKWPQHYVTGVPVTVEQAKEIIRRTDTFFSAGYDGNNHQYNRWVRKTLGMPPSSWDRPHRPWPKDDAPQAEKDADKKIRQEEWAEERRLQDEFERRWHPLSTSYVHNSWVSCSYIGGPHGWMHPDGQIGFIDNVGKHPSVQDIYEDWQILAEAFSFIDVGVSLYDGEWSEEGIEKVVSMRVQDGKVWLVEPTVDVHLGHPEATRRAGALTDTTSEFIASWGNSRREQGLPDSWIHEWARKFGPEAKAA